jgi:flagellar basal-body rod modification protein FlgD
METTSISAAPLSERAFQMNAQDRADTDRMVQKHNAELSAETKRSPKHELGKDDFLKLLLTQLAYQDPTAPMEDKEFIAQMAQFSSLEQMNQMAADFSRMADMLTGGNAAAALGKSVELTVGDRVIQGTVNAVTRGKDPQVMVNGTNYPWEQVTKVFQE